MGQKVAVLAVLTLVTAQSLPALTEDRPLNKEELAAEAFLQEYDKSLGTLWNEQTKAQWNYQTNLTDHNNEVYLNASSKVSLMKQDFLCAVQSTPLINSSLFINAILIVIN